MLKMIDKVAWIHVQDKKILSTLSRGKQTYYLPGGKREPGEPDEACLTREIEEELNVQITPGSLQYMGTFEAPAHGHAENVLVKMTCYSAAYTGTLAPSSEIECYRWLTHADKHLCSAVDQIIFDYLLSISLIE
ncbi:ADP-ribose pyrophosphatase YjhB (NUDIX family) [Chitinophaga skermanii]|uniref:ADP-ribose pyrophosphatase YjhB (NUDIX family) n=1 Tax=Chitinophaga skermanii TaxID=331697 RepID=A0A327QMH7_9BACT|nr:NUDIX domain-containing protein [Chitinophaga skermanii]RAJ05461.1 ADP-ribose pyrophosphatase YjhB (NUDIX family) [Chitinophaga skermanii]